VAYVKASVREEQIIAAARRVMSEHGVAGTTLRAVATEADIALGTLHYVFPSKDQLLRAVITDLMEEISRSLRSQLELGDGVEHAIREGIGGAWTRLTTSELGQQIMQYELSLYSLRSEDLGSMARWQYERYATVLTEWCEQAAAAAGERCAIGFDSLGRIILATLDGLVLQYLANPDQDRANRDLQHALDMFVLLADPQPVASGRARRQG